MRMSEILPMENLKPWQFTDQNHQKVNIKKHGSSIRSQSTRTDGRKKPNYPLSCHVGKKSLSLVLALAGDFVYCDL